MGEEMWVEGLLGLLILVASLILIRWSGGKNKMKERQFPPGPFAWPIVGHLPLFLNLPHQVLRDASKQYGNLLGLRLGRQRAVVVSSPELAKLVLLTHDQLFADRPAFTFITVMLFGNINGLAFARYGAFWRKHRKLCMLHLFTAKRLQDLQYVRQEEIRTLMLSIHHQSSASQTGAIDIGSCVGKMSSRLLMRLLQSKATMQVGGENLHQIIKEEEPELTPTVGDFIPYLSWLDVVRKRRMRAIHGRLDKMYTELIRERQQESTCRAQSDLLDYLLSQEEPLTVDEIKTILNDMVTAGIHTLSLSLEWAMAELLRHPACLDRLRKEIDTQLGTEKKLATDEDLPNLSYLKCVIKETFRLHPVVPLLVPRISVKECELQGYTIPARTLVFVNVWAIGRDEQVWPNASEFVPERFENKATDLKGQHFELLPFGSGRRICLGLPLALPVMETALANLVRCFDWELPNGEAPTSINMDEKSGLAAGKNSPLFATPKPREFFSELSDT